MTAVRWSKLAQNDLDEIWFYVAQDSRNAADALVDQIVETARPLTLFPHIGAARPELGQALRALPVGSYVLFYRSDERGVRVERVLHGRRDIRPELF